jgi:hypothetical protein
MQRRSRSARLSLVALGAAGLAASAAAGASSCIASGPDLSQITGKPDAGFNLDDAGAGGSSSSTGIAPTDPHAVIGAQPSHGPFSGGQRVLIRGNGFGSDVKVWFGATLATEVVPVDATKVQVTAPAGAAGPVDLTVQDGDDTSTKRTLAGGYTFDALYAEPASGPIAGGTEVHLHGQGTQWASGTQAFIDQVACASLTVVSPTELVCVAPKGTPGSKTVRVSTGAETISVLDAYTYEDSVDGYKGGLSGQPLTGKLRVLVYDNFKGDPVPGAHVVVGTDPATEIRRDVDATGVVEITDPSLASPVTVTVAASCMSPITFVKEPVDTVTVYLNPILSPLCGSAGGDPPGTGTKVGSVGLVTGQIVFPADMEFKRGSWTVPSPIGAEQMTAYVFSAQSTPLASFTLPSPTSAITPQSPGSVGYQFSYYTTPGAKTLYVLAGLEDRSKSPATFVPYTMGIVKGVPVQPNEVTKDVFIPMKSPLDEALILHPTPPAPGPKGPDRLQANVAIRLGSDGYAILPQGQKTPLLPLGGDVTFVGVPYLGGALTGSTYVASTRAVTGPGFGAPMSVIGGQQSTTTAFPLQMTGFVGVPVLVTPALNTSWDARHLETQFGSGNAPIDLTVYDVSAMGGLQHWTVAAPGGSQAIELPDLSVYPDADLASGAVTIGVYGAHIDGFDYKSLRYKNLSPAGMTAFSLDYTSAHLP